MVIRTFSELTWVLMVHVPNANKAFLNNELEYSESWVGSSPFFFFSPDHREVKHGVTYTDSPNIYTKDWRMPGTPPDYRSHYKNDRFVFDKPIVIVNNKYISEWNNPPINFFSVEDLKIIFNTLKSKYTIVYIRSTTKERGYWDDNQAGYELGEYELIKNVYPEVVCMNDLLETNPDLSYNTLQLMLHANSNKFLSIAGGNAVISSYFGGENIVYRDPKVHSNGRLIWHSNSNLTTLSNAKIVGTNNKLELYKLVSKWT